MSIQGDLDTENLVPEPDEKTAVLVDKLVEYKREAEHNRKEGLNPRDDKWMQNNDLYWNRHDFSNKAAWQSKNVMPEVPSYVDRFAGALKDALVQSEFYTVTDPYDANNDLTDGVKKMTDVWLSTIGKNQIGQPQPFSTVFEEQAKMGALMAMSGVVLWKDDVPGGRVAFESVDPRYVWLDHTYRNLYRIRTTEVDAADIARMAKSKTKKGKPLYDPVEMDRLLASVIADLQVKRSLSGNGENVTSGRDVIRLDEYMATVLSDDGKLLMDRQTALVAQDEFLLRGPEKNPFWHGQDWLVYTPLMPVPMSPYGRTYMEDFGSVAKVYTDLTNLLLDATYMSSMKAYAMVPGMLKDPSQANTGIYPNKTFMLEEGYSPEEFMKAIELGSLDAGAVQIWNSIKGSLSDAAGMNEIGLGQLPDKTHIAATAVSGAQQSSSAILRSVAQTIETRFLDPLLDLVWKTGLQKAKQDDPRMMQAIGSDMYYALIANRRELIRQPITFQARGISGLIQKSQKLQSLLGVLQIMAGNPQLLQAFMMQVDIPKLVREILRLSGVDIKQLQPTEREALITQLQQPMEQAAQGGSAPAPNGAAMAMGGDIANATGMAK